MKIDLWNFVFVNVFRPRNLAISSDNRLFWTVPHDILRTKQGMNKIQRTMKQEPAWFEHFVSSTSSDTQYACFFEQCHTTYLEPTGMNKIQRTMKQEPAWLEHFVSSTSSDNRLFWTVPHDILRTNKEWTRFNGRWSKSQHGWNILFRHFIRYTIRVLFWTNQQGMNQVIRVNATALWVLKSEARKCILCMPAALWVIGL